MEVLKRARRPVRRRVENYIRELEMLLDEAPLNYDKIEVTFKLLSDVCETLQTHDSAIVAQLTKDGTPAPEEDKEWDEIGELNSRVETIRHQKEKLVPFENAQITQSVNNAMDTPVRNFKLPTVELKKFSGEIRDWLGFWAQFQKIHDDTQMNGSDKYWYLLQSLEPKTDAYEIVTGYPASNENYEIVIDALKKQYGNEDLLLQVYIREILSLVISNVNSKEKLPMKNLFLKLDSNLRALTTLNLANADPATWLFPLVESCLPEQILYNWQRSPLSSYDGSADEPPKTRLDTLMSFVEREVEIRQRIELTRAFATQQRGEPSEKRAMLKDKKIEERKRVPTLSSFHNAESRKCVFCDMSNHQSGDCGRAKRMSYHQKLDILKEKRLCFRCTGNHYSHMCKASNLHCGKCRRNHLTVLCRDNVLDEKKRVTGMVQNEMRGNNHRRAKRKLSMERLTESGGSSFKRPGTDGGAQVVKRISTQSKIPSSENESLASMYLSMSVQDASIAKLWELEVIGVEDPSKECSEKMKLELEIEKFMDNISRNPDGRYVVKLPWKNNLSLSFQPACSL
ncbi:unnamed protein product [Orchesella dallaii]|uniref:Uncharacterized protein n=1 Tax=Orchesella dallaii TaxID=48710 RepID=A0ABP1QIU6_9HEXA